MTLLQFTKKPKFLADIAGTSKNALKTVREAKMAAAFDRLSAVYVNASEVFVITAFGTGRFAKSEWERG